MPTSQLLSIDLETLDLLTVAEVAGVLRVSKMTIYRMCHSGELVSTGVGRSLRVPSKAVRTYLGIETAHQEVG